MKRAGTKMANPIKSRRRSRAIMVSGLDFGGLKNRNMTVMVIAMNGMLILPDISSTFSGLRMGYYGKGLL